MPEALPGVAEHDRDPVGRGAEGLPLLGEQEEAPVAEARPVPAQGGEGLEAHVLAGGGVPAHGAAAATPAGKVLPGGALHRQEGALRVDGLDEVLVGAEVVAADQAAEGEGHVALLLAHAAHDGAVAPGHHLAAVGVEVEVTARLWKRYKIRRFLLFNFVCTLRYYTTFPLIK